MERWLEGWLNGRIDQDLRNLESAYAAKKAELDEYRRTLLQHAANAQAAAAARAAPQPAAPAAAAAPQPPVAQGRPADAPSLI